jgi:hypothetical protein
MEKRARKSLAAAMTAAGLVLAGSPANAQPTRPVVVKLEYRIRVTPGVLQSMEKAQKHATEIYETTGISLVWTDRGAGRDHPDAMAVTVMLLSDNETEELLKNSRDLPQRVLGCAPLQTWRVYLFWDRILRRARKDQVLPSVVLGRVLAHEIGHHLLPRKRHSTVGLMRASLDYQLPEPPAFTDEQAEAIRTLLIAAN